MKVSILGLLLILVATSACRKHEEPAATPAPPSAPAKSVNAILGETGAAAPAPPPAATPTAAPDAAASPAPAASSGSEGDPVDLSALNKALDSYIRQTGKEPTKLEDLVAKGFIPALPKAPPGMKLRYDFAAVRIFMVPDNGGK